MKNDNKLFGFEKLDVWKKSRQLVNRVYDLIDKFPQNEEYSLSKQIRRSSVSVSANIVEGTSRHSKKDFARYLEISYGSLVETLNHLYLALDRKYITSVDIENIRPLFIEVAQKLSALRRSLIN
jgi:four helix bundle protein